MFQALAGSADSRYKTLEATDRSLKKKCTFTAIAMNTFRTSGVCSQSITFDVAADGTVHSVCFEGGCNGNAQAVAKLVEGRQTGEIVTLLAGIRCAENATSCPDQLAIALRQYSQGKTQ